MLDSLLNFIFFPICAGCSEPGKPICYECLEALETAHLKCHRCDQKNPYGIYCAKCSNKYTPERVLALYHFSGTIKELIHSFKYEDEKSLAGVFGTKMAKFAKDLKLVDFTIVPIPISRKSQSFRGFNQSELLAREVAEDTELKYANFLKRNPRQNSQVQAGSRNERKANVKGAFILENKIKLPSKILLIDDVVTTGATVEEAAKVLKKAGAKEVIVLALAMG